MKIFILSDPESIHTKRWVVSLAEKGCQIFLFGLGHCDFSFYNCYPQVIVYRIDIITGLNCLHQNGAFAKWRYLKVMKQLKQKISEFNPDILHAHYASSYGLLGALTGFHPYIISVWGSDVYDFPKSNLLKKWVLKYNLKKADRILSTSHVMARETHKYTKKRIEVTPFGVDINHFRKLFMEREKGFIVGNVKTLSPKYGIDVLIKAFHMVVSRNPQKDVKLVIVGEGPNKKEYEELTYSLGLGDKVRFEGKIANHRLPEYYNRFSVSVSVSDSESFGVVAVEAMSCECPVITSDADGFTEVIKDEETGFIVPKRDVKATANAIQRFIDHPELREKMGKRGRERVIELYDWEKNVKLMIEIYNNILNEYSIN